jgi:ACS family glucarate transporter-like MFS transporter
MRVVVWWSFFTAATGWVWNLASLLVTRPLFAMGEAGCSPNQTRAFTTWLPRRERERAQAILWLGARWGGAFTPLLVASIPALHHVATGLRDLRRRGDPVGVGILSVVSG